MPPNNPALSQEDARRSVIEETNSSSPEELYKLQRQTDRARQRERMTQILQSGDTTATDEEDQPIVPAQKEGSQPREDITPLKSKPKPPKIPSQPQPVVPEEKDGGWIDYIEWFASPLMGITGSEAILALTAKAQEDASSDVAYIQEHGFKDYLGETVKNAPENIAESTSVAAKATLARLFPDINNLPPDYGSKIAERIAPDSSPGVKTSIAATFNVLSDPGILLGIPALKTFQSGVRASQIAGVGNDGVWTLGLKDLLGVLNVSDIPVVQATRSGKQISRAAQKQLEILEDFGLTKEKGFDLSKHYETTMKGKELVSGGMDADLTKYSDEIAEGAEMPPIAVYKRKDGLYEVIDGSHRLHSTLKNDPEANVKVLVIGEESASSRAAQTSKVDITRRRLIQAGMSAPIAAKFAKFGFDGSASTAGKTVIGLADAQKKIATVGQLNDVLGGAYEIAVKGRKIGLRDPKTKKILNVTDEFQEIIKRIAKDLDIPLEKLDDPRVPSQAQIENRLITAAHDYFKQGGELEEFVIERIKEKGIDTVKDDSLFSLDEELIQNNPLLTPHQLDDFQIGDEIFLDYQPAHIKYRVRNYLNTIKRDPESANAENALRDIKAFIEAFGEPAARKQLVEFNEHLTPEQKQQAIKEIFDPVSKALKEPVSSRGSQAGKQVAQTPESTSEDATGPVGRFLKRRSEGKAAQQQAKQQAKQRFDWKASKDPHVRKMLALAEKADKGDKEALGRLNQLLESEFGTRMARAKMEDDARKVMPAIDEVMGHADDPLIRSVKEDPASVIPDRMYDRLVRKSIQIQEQESLTRAKPRYQGPALKPNVPLNEQPKLTLDRMRRAAEDLAQAKRKLPKNPSVQEERIFVKKLDETRDELRRAIDTYGADEVERVILRENPNLTDAQIKGLMDERVLDTSFVAAPRTTLRGVLEQHLADRHIASLADNVNIKNTEVNYYKLNTLADVDQLVAETFESYSKNIDEIFSPENLKKEVKITKGQTADEMFEQSEALTDELIARMDPEAPIPEVPPVERTTKQVAMSQAEVDAWQQQQLEQLLGRKAVKRSGKESYVWRQMLLDSARRIKNLAGRVDSQVGKTDADEIALVKAIYTHKILTERAAGITPKASAEALHSLALSAKSPAGRLAEIKRLKPLVAESRRNNKIFSKLAKSSSDEAITKMVESMFRARPMDVLYEVFVNNILFGPVTHAINITSNAFVMMAQPLQKTTEAMSAAALGRFADASLNLAEARVMLSAIHETVFDWVHIAAKTGKPTLEMPEELARLHELYRVRHHPSITSEALNVTGRLGSIIDFIGKGVRLPGDALLKEDMAYKMIHYRMSVNDQAIRIAKSKGRNAREVAQYYEMLRRNPLASMSESGVEFANYNTFTNSLGRIAQPIHTLRNSTPGVRWVIPFWNTPTNIVKMGVRHSIFGNFFKDTLGLHMKEGGGVGFGFNAFKNTPEGDVARAKIALGTALTGGLVMKFSGTDEDGIPYITGHINTGTPMGRFMQSKGIPPYSIRIGDEWHSYEAIEPLKSILGLITTYRDTINHLDMEEDDHMELAWEAATTAMAPFIKVIGDNYLMPQVSQLMWMIESMIAEPTDDSAPMSETYGPRYFKRLGATLLVNNFLTQFRYRAGFLEGTPGEALYDPTFRQAETFLQHIQNRVPGLSQYLPAYVDIWGEERTMPNSLGPDLVSPVNTLKENKDFVDLIIMDLGRKKLLSLPGMKKEIRGVRMDIWEREQYAKLVGKGDPNLGIPPLKEEIKQILLSPTVKALPDEGKAEIIKQYINRRRTAMDGLFIQQNKEFRERFIKKQEQEALKFQPQPQVQAQ